MEEGYCHRIISQHLKELGDGFRAEQDDGNCLILTPYVLPDNDTIEVKVHRRGGRLVVSDQGSTLGFLFLNGIDLNPHSRQEAFFLQQIRRFGLRASAGEIEIDVPESEVGDAVSRVVEASKAISYLIYTFRGRTGGDFKGEVADWLSQNEIAFEADAQVEGASGRHFTMDFVHRRSGQAPVFLKALHSETRGYAKTLTYATVALWADLGKKHTAFRSVSLLDDSVGETWDEQVSMLETHSDRVAYWTTREELLPELA